MVPLPIKRAACSRSRASGCAILPRVQVPSECYRAGAEEPAPSAGAGLAVAHPYERLVASEILAQEIWNGTDDLGVLLSLITGDLPAPPLARFCGIAPVEAETDRITWKLHGHRRNGADHPPGRDGFGSGGPQSVFPAPGFTRRA